MNMGDLRILAKDKALPDDMIIMMYSKTIDTRTGKTENHVFNIKAFQKKPNKIAPHKAVVLFRTEDVKWDSATADGNIITP